MTTGPEEVFEEYEIERGRRLAAAYISMQMRESYQTAYKRIRQTGDGLPGRMWMMLGRQIEQHIVAMQDRDDQDPFQTPMSTTIH
jgi:hypothetical protein